MLAPSALAMALGVVAIGVNVFLTSLVCNEITSAWSDLDSELTEIKGILKSVSESIEDESPKDRVARADSSSLDGESTIKSARITRRRLLNQLRHRNAPMYEIDGDSNEDSSSEHQSDITLPRKTTCDCKAFKNKCPVGSPGHKGTKGAKGLNGPNGRKGYPGLPGPSLHKHIHIRNCALCAPGPRGLAGKVGILGAPGAAGAPGASGAAGHPSPKGVPGQPGEEGSQGPEGKMGPPGEDGMPAEKLTPMKGEKGSRGPQGPEGPQGDMGAIGPPGPPNTIIGKPGQVGTPGRPGRAGHPGIAGNIGSDGEKVCECFVYLQQEEPNEPGHYLPIVESRRADIRRAPVVPLIPFDEPVASQIYVEKVGNDVTSKDRKTLFYYNQSGQVNLAIAKGQSVAPPFVRGGTSFSAAPRFIGRNPPVGFGFTTTTTTEEPQRYRYLSDEEVASIPANIFTKRRRLHGTKTFKTARAFAIENDLLGIEKPKKGLSMQTNQREKSKNPLIKRKWGRFTRVFRSHKGPFLPLSRSSHISARIVMSRRKRPQPLGPVMLNNNVNKQ